MVFLRASGPPLRTGSYSNSTFPQARGQSATQLPAYTHARALGTTIFTAPPQMAKLFSSNFDCVSQIHTVSGLLHPSASNAPSSNPAPVLSNVNGLGAQSSRAFSQPKTTECTGT